MLTALGGEDVTIVSDAGNHASIIDACRLSRSTIVVVPHRDVDKFDSALAARSTSYAVVVTDAVFSVDGDLAPLRELHTIARQHEALLVVDEAHALGVVGTTGEVLLPRPSWLVRRTSSAQSPCPSRWERRAGR